MTTILDTLLKELREERDMAVEAVARDLNVDIATLRLLQGKIWVVDRIFMRVDELRKSPDEIEEDDQT